MLKMFPGSNLQRGRVRYLIESAHAQFLKAEDKISFLAMGVDFDFLSESLSRFGITRSTVSMPPNTVLDYVVPNKMVIDLENTRKELKLPKRITLDWVKHLTGINVTGAMMDKLLKDYCKHRSNKGKKPIDYINLCQKNFMDSSNPSFPKSVSSSKEPPPSKIINTSSSSNYIALKESLDVSKELLRAEHSKIEALTEEIETLKCIIKSCRAKTKHYRHKLWRAEEKISKGREKVVEVSRKRKLHLDEKESKILKFEHDVKRKKTKLDNAKKVQTDLKITKLVKEIVLQSICA